MVQAFSRLKCLLDDQDIDHAVLLCGPCGCGCACRGSPGAAPYGAGIRTVNAAPFFAIYPLYDRPLLPRVPRSLTSPTKRDSGFDQNTYDSLLGRFENRTEVGGDTVLTCHAKQRG